MSNTERWGAVGGGRLGGLGSGGVWWGLVGSAFPIRTH